MKIVIDIPEDKFDLIQISAMNGMGDFLHKIVAQGTPLEEELKAIKEDMKDTFYDYKNNRYDVSMEGVLDVLDKHIKERINNDKRQSN